MEEIIEEGWNQRVESPFELNLFIVFSFELLTYFRFFCTSVDIGMRSLFSGWILVRSLTIYCLSSYAKVRNFKLSEREKNI